jgi:undecaprenyl-diphosphatase
VSVLSAAALAALQGITEFIPVSSSGHLVLAGWLMELPREGILFEVVVHLGTLVAVLGVYGRDLLGLLAGAFRGERRSLRTIGLLVLASVPAAAAGLLLGDLVERCFASPLLTSLMLILTGTVLFFVRKAAQGKAELPGPTAALAVGLAQALSLLPGVSRSGLTVSAGLLTGLRQDMAARFSFLLAVPAIAGAGMLKLGTAHTASVPTGSLLVGLAVSALVGYLALRLLLRFLRMGRFTSFCYYCWTVGALGVVLALTKGLP